MISGHDWEVITGPAREELNLQKKSPGDATLTNEFSLNDRLRNFSGKPESEFRFSGFLNQTVCITAYSSRGGPWTNHISITWELDETAPQTYCVRLHFDRC